MAMTAISSYGLRERLKEVAEQALYQRFLGWIPRLPKTDWPKRWPAVRE